MNNDLSWLTAMGKKIEEILLTKNLREQYQSHVTSMIGFKNSTIVLSHDARSFQIYCLGYKNTPSYSFYYHVTMLNLS
jgi:hypothetical protein